MHVEPDLDSPPTLRCCVVRETRLDTARIQSARRVIDPLFLDTPLYRCEAMAPSLGCTVSIKLETTNPVGSFKARGTEVVASLLADAGSDAMVCASAGNLGQALAWSGRTRGLDVTVVASRFAPAIKLDRIRALDARLELVDGDIEIARERAAAIARHEGIRLVEDSLDIETCEGAATIGLELVDTAPSFDAVLIALGGGASHRSRPHCEGIRARRRGDLHSAGWRTGHDALVAPTPRCYHRLDPYDRRRRRGPLSHSSRPSGSSPGR